METAHRQKNNKSRVQAKLRLADAHALSADMGPTILASQRWTVIHIDGLCLRKANVHARKAKSWLGTLSLYLLTLALVSLTTQPPQIIRCA